MNNFTSSYHSFNINPKDFKILHQLKAEDAYSTYTVLNEKTGHIYKALLLKKSGQDEIKYKESVNQFIGNLFKCQHPTLLHFIGYSLKDFNDEDNSIVYMEYLKNSLSNLLYEKKSIDHTNIQIILIGITKAMIILKQHNIKNFNLNPDNILLDEKLRPHLTNIISNIIKYDKKTASIYTAPENIQGKPFDEKSAVYSFGIIMYQMLVDPLQQLLNNDQERSKYIEKVVSENYRPAFTTSIKQSYKSLIEKCWSTEKNERPTFDELYQRLAFNIEDSFYDIYEENKYYLDNVNIQKIQVYVNNIDNNSSFNIDEIPDKLNELKERFNYLNNIIDPLKKENEKLLDIISELKPQIFQLKEENVKLKKENIILKAENHKIQSMEEKNEEEHFDITINEFNKLPLQSKQLIISDIINTFSEFEKDQFFINLNNLLIFLLKYDQTKFCRNFIISSDDNSDFLLSKDKKYGIQFNYEIMELLLNCDISEFNVLLQKFEDILVELKYPSKSFDFFNGNINKINRTHIKFALFVTGICKTDTALSQKSYINYVRIDSTLTEISGGFSSRVANKISGSFSYCTSLIHIEIPDSVTTIGKAAFSSCTSLKIIEIPSSVTFIDDYAFEDCKSLKIIKIPNNLTYIGSCIFKGCSSLEHIYIPDSVTSFGKEAFSECSKLTEFNIPPKITSINDSILKGCSSLTHITLPSSITSIMNDSFNGCCFLKQIEIPSSVKSIGNNAFKGCSSLKVINIPISVISIGSGAFSECSSIEKFEIPSTWESIAPLLFSNCVSLKTIEIPKSITSIENGAFSGCTSLAHINIPSTVTNIGDNAFEKCSSLTSIIIPLSVSNIGSNAFNGCSLFTEFEVPSKITVINDCVFANCSSLTKIDIPLVTMIGKSAFQNCSMLPQINIPSSVLCINSNAFDSCALLTIIKIPSSVTTIESHAFRNCTSLVHIKIPNSVTSIGNGAFESCKFLEEIEIPSSVTKIEDYLFSQCESLSKVILPSSVTIIGKMAFSYCFKLVEINLPSSLTIIDEYAFMESAINKITIPKSLTKLIRYCFRKCNSLVSVEFLSSQTYFDNLAFDSCPLLRTVKIPQGVPTSAYQGKFSPSVKIINS